MEQTNQSDIPDFNRKYGQIVNILGTFENEDIKEFALRVVNELPKYWWMAPASSTGKYHPEYSLGDGGLLKHSIAVIKFLNYFFDIDYIKAEFSSRERDLLRLAGLVHDGLKQGYSEEGEGTTVFDHPILMAQRLLSYANQPGQNQLRNVDEYFYISTVIASHMGQWNTASYSNVVLPQPQLKQQKILALADYLASRKSIMITDF